DELRPAEHPTLRRSEFTRTHKLFRKRSHGLSTATLNQQRVCMMENEMRIYLGGSIIRFGATTGRKTATSKDVPAQ
ncbi:hypothetical protein Q2317_25670, partial [Escherichia coli]|nr:hypothetical protein [Escherichia coli]